MESRGLCDNPVEEKGGRVLGLKALNTLKGLSELREDSVIKKLKDDHHGHTHCYKAYSKKENCRKSSECTKILGRSGRRPFDYQTHGLICGDQLNFECAKQHPDRKEVQISEVEIVDKTKKSILRESLLRNNLCGRYMLCGSKIS